MDCESEGGGWAACKTLNKQHLTTRILVGCCNYRSAMSGMGWDGNLIISGWGGEVQSTDQSEVGGFVQNMGPD